MLSDKEFNFEKILSNSIFKEAIRLASPELYYQILKWEKGELKAPKLVEKLKLSILKYYTRMSTRCTPFGLFAACSHGSFKNNSKNTFPIIDNNINRITKFDNTFLTLLLNELLKIDLIRDHLLFYPNTSLYRIGNHYRYVEYKTENSKRKYSLEGFQYDDAIENILIKFKNGEKISKVAYELADNVNSLEETKEFINILISNQILISELEINLTGKDSFLVILDRIEKVTSSSELLKKLKNLHNLIQKIDKNKKPQLNLYDEIVDIAKEIVPNLNTKFLFQTNCYKNTSTDFSNINIQNQLNNAFYLLNKITLPSANRNLVVFKEKFLKRFDQREVSLNLVLDFETGIGYGPNNINEDSFLTNIQISKKEKRYQSVIWSDGDSIFQKKLINAIKNNKYIIKLNEKDLSDLPINFNDLPDTTSSIIEVYNINESQQIFINGIGGSSAINLLARFSHGNANLSKTIRKIKLIEEQINSDRILAEIIHLPEARTGNILQRGFQRSYEIPYLGKSSLSSGFQIPLNDIMISIRNNEIILRSKKLNKIIAPKLSTAHNYTNSNLPVYNFLCDLQNQNKRSNIGFKWNKIMNEYNFLPRVVFDNIIFSKACWRIKLSDFRKVFQEDDLIINVKKWQKLNAIPDYVDLVEGDNKLLINFNNYFSIKMLFDAVKTKEYFILEEFLFNSSKMVKDKKGNHYCNQFIVSFFNRNKYEKR